MVNKIESVKIEGKEYNTEALTADRLSQFVRDVNSTKSVAAVCKNYGVAEV